MATDAVEQLILEGDLVRHVRMEVLTETRLQDFLPYIENRPPITIGILPKSALLVHWDQSVAKDSKAQILAEVAAGMFTCQYNNHRYQLSLPWTYFLFDFQTSGDPMEGRNWVNTNTRVYWSRENVQTLDQELMTALVPNVDNRGQICWGTTSTHQSMALANRVDQTLDEFYRTNFTHSNGAGSPWMSETGRDDWTKWVEESKKDPAAFLKFPEWDHKKGAKVPGLSYTTVRQIMGSLGDRSAPIEVLSKIPEMVSPMTFGRAEEWLMTKLSSEERGRLKVALANIEAENPAALAPVVLAGV